MPKACPYAMMKSQRLKSLLLDGSEHECHIVREGEHVVLSAYIVVTHFYSGFNVVFLWVVEQSFQRFCIAVFCFTFNWC